MIMSAGIGFWTKVFNDNSYELGSDPDIKAGKASWTRGRLDNIKIVIISDGATHVHLDVPGGTDWYQFDRFVVPVSVGTQTPLRTHRAIQAKIQEPHIGSYLYAEGFSRDYCFFISPDKAHSDSITNCFCEEITEEMLDMWVTVIIPHGKKPYYTIVNNKGSINGDFKQILK